DAGGCGKPGKASDGARMNALEVCQVMPKPTIAVRSLGSRQRVQGVADRTVAQCVEMNLESFPVQCRDEPWELARVDEVQAGRAGRAPIAVQVRLQHGGSVV